MPCLDAYERRCLDTQAQALASLNGFAMMQQHFRTNKILLEQIEGWMQRLAARYELLDVVRSTADQLIDAIEEANTHVRFADTKLGAAMYECVKALNAYDDHVETVGAVIV